ncbi:hypothetical protein GOBAR_AA26313 [Gossypium barbadense]|uniref:DUF4283 domain-containing protein n=1 Tax=Gossypium barbadense TaxID=3634 RepID=A0A2P5WTE9_GOSBA|nr:hypothetical protein GOBAR_AA26313 [Gossypium barbadense]
MEDGFKQLSLQDKEEVKLEIATLLSLWRPLQGARIKQIGDGSLYLIQCYHLVDLKKIISKGPWSFNKCLLLTHKLKKGQSPTGVKLFFANFYV